MAINYLDLLTIFALCVQPPPVGRLCVDVADLQPKMFQSQHQHPLKLGSGGWMAAMVVVGIISPVYVFSASRPPLANHTSGHLN